MAVSFKVRNAITAKKCHYCDLPPWGWIEVEHVIPRCRGGSDDPSNLVPACRWCNRDKGAHTPEEWRQCRLQSGLSWPPRWFSPEEWGRTEGTLAEREQGATL